MVHRSSVFYLTCLLIGVVLTVGLSDAWADVGTSTNPNANINKGNSQVGGSFNLTYNTLAGIQLVVNPQYEYFFADRFSLGVTTYYKTNDNYSTLQAGPAATYYFWAGEKAAAYIYIDVIDEIGSYAGYVSGDASLGLNYFVTPAVAFGPSFEYTHSFSPSAISPDYFGLYANFSIYFP